MQTHPYPSQGPGSGIETYLSPSQGEIERVGSSEQLLSTVWIWEESWIEPNWTD